MNAKDRKSRLQYLKARIAIKNRTITSVLFDECIEALGEQTIIFSLEKSKKIYEVLTNEYEITFYGRIEWSLYDYIEITAEEIENNKVGIDSSTEAYVLWSHGSDPVIQTMVKSAFKILDDLTAVSPDVWIYKPNEFVIEIFHDGIIRGHKKKLR